MMTYATLGSTLTPALQRLLKESANALIWNVLATTNIALN
jgi:hypothetical protein